MTDLACKSLHRVLWCSLSDLAFTLLWLIHPEMVPATTCDPPLSQTGTAQRPLKLVLLLHPVLPQADGHCLYRSLEEQLEATAAAAAAEEEEQQQPGLLKYQELRELAAEHIRQHK